MVNNKCDLTNVDDLIIPKVNDFESWVSAKANTGIEDLKEKINNHFNEGIYKGWISIDSSAGKLRSRLFALGCVDEEKVSNEQIYLSITMGIKLLNEFMQNEDLQLIEIDTTASKVS
jgi:GTP-binding protein HflX